MKVVATGSSALGIGAGSKESLAGRFERLTLTHWSSSAVFRAFGVEPEEAVEQDVRMKAYPGASELLGDLIRWAAYVRDAIVEPAIGRDILALATVRRPALLRQVFPVAASSPAQVVSLQKLQGQLQDRGALETIAHYLALLEGAYLIRGHYHGLATAHCEYGGLKSRLQKAVEILGVRQAKRVSRVRGKECL